MIPRPVEVGLHAFLSEKKGKSFLLAVSGGLDSMALLQAFYEVAPKIPVTFAVVHIHHGPGHGSEAEEQKAFRDQAERFVKRACAEKKIPFFNNDISEIYRPLKSEQEFRRLRLEELAKLKAQSASDYVVFAHHADDLLETRLLRLIRGTGPEGLVAMKVENGVRLRPFLHHSRAELEEYVEKLSVPWIEDPSNIKSHYLRNWLRNKWLPALERRYAGAAHSLGRSLQSIADFTQTAPSLEHCFEGERLLRSEFMLLSASDKRRVLGIYLRQVQCLHFGLSHLNELIKRLDVEQTDLTFRVLKKNWRANARHIWSED